MIIKENEKLPAFYGYAWRRGEHNDNAAFIIPFNFIVGWFMFFRSRLKLGPNLNQGHEPISFWFFRSKN